MAMKFFQCWDVNGLVSYEPFLFFPSFRVTGHFRSTWQLVQLKE